MLETA